MTNPEHYIFSSKTVSQVDQRAIHQEDILGFILMKRAAAFSFQQLEKYFSNKNAEPLPTGADLAKIIYY